MGNLGRNIKKQRENCRSVLIRAFVAMLSLSYSTAPAAMLLPRCPAAGDTTEVRHMGTASVSGHKTTADVLATKPLQTMERTEIEALGLENVAEAVKRFAGTTVRDYGGVGGMKTVSVRNLGAHHTAVSYDGIVVSNTQAGQIDIGRYLLDNVERLTLSTGHSDNLMQSARHYAAASVLDIESKTPLLRTERNNQLRLTMKTGSFGLANPSLHYDRRLARRTVLSLDGNFMRSDGTYPYSLLNASKRSKEKRYNSEVTSWQGQADLRHAFADGSQMHLKTMWYRSERGLPGTVIFYANPSEERLWDEDFYAQALYSKRFSRQWQLQGRMKYTHTWNRYTDPRYKFRDVNRQNEYYASATAGWQPLENLSFALAQDIAFNDLRNNILRNVEVVPANPRRFTSLTALTAQWRTARVNIQGNLTGTYATEDVHAGKKPDDRRRLSPTVAATWRLLPEQSFFARLMYKNTFRMPTFNDQYYYRMGSTNLKPEKATEYNAGLTWSGSPARWIKYLSLTVDGYYNHVHDKIVAFPTTYVWKMANFGKVEIWGIDVTMATEIPLTRNVSALLTGNFTQQRAKDKTNPKSQTYNNDVPYTPRSHGNLSIILNNPWVNVGYSLCYCGSRYSMGQNKPEYRIRQYTESSLTLSRDFQLGASRLKLAASVVNLENKQYEVVKYYPMPRRSWHLTATFQW